ncbi:scaffold attachment factor B2-like [Haliotis rubra]|uniref:scaffold attachment factor B2-like n=1 Tax=Haliotis rubra TaxID=36100 RepID=UPI001EE52C45|nr:scaffold attachment factor B2-like [Haliotis rubra]
MAILRTHRVCKSNLKKSGKGRKLCKFFEELDAILGTRPASSPLKVIDTLTKKVEDEGGDSCEPDDTAQANTQAVGESCADITPLADNETERDEKDASDTESRKNKRKESTEGESEKVKSEKKRARKTRMEVPLKSVMNGFSAANERADDKVLDLERQKIELERQKLDVEKAKIESDERQKREERQHQFNMMNMIMRAERRTGQQPPPVPYSTGRTAQYDGGETL